MDKPPYFIRDTTFTTYHIKANLSICFRTFVRAIQLSKNTHKHLLLGKIPYHH